MKLKYPVMYGDDDVCTGKIYTTVMCTKACCERPAFRRCIDPRCLICTTSQHSSQRGLKVQVSKLLIVEQQKDEGQKMGRWREGERARADNERVGTFPGEGAGPRYRAETELPPVSTLCTRGSRLAWTAQSLRRRMRSATGELQKRVRELVRG